MSTFFSHILHVLSQYIIIPIPIYIPSPASYFFPRAATDATMTPDTTDASAPAPVHAPEVPETNSHSSSSDADMTNKPRPASLVYSTRWKDNTTPLATGVGSCAGVGGTDFSGSGKPWSLKGSVVAPQISCPPVPTTVIIPIPSPTSPNHSGREVLHEQEQEQGREQVQEISGVRDPEPSVQSSRSQKPEPSENQGPNPDRDTDTDADTSLNSSFNISLISDTSTSTSASEDDELPEPSSSPTDDIFTPAVRCQPRFESSSYHTNHDGREVSGDNDLLAIYDPHLSGFPELTRSHSQIPVLTKYGLGLSGLGKKDGEEGVFDGLGLVGVRSSGRVWRRGVESIQEEEEEEGRYQDQEEVGAVVEVKKDKEDMKDEVKQVEEDKASEASSQISKTFLREAVYTWLEDPSHTQLAPIPEGDCEGEGEVEAKGEEEGESERDEEKEKEDEKEPRAPSPMLGGMLVESPESDLLELDLEMELVRGEEEDEDEETEYPPQSKATSSPPSPRNEIKNTKTNTSILFEKPVHASLSDIYLPSAPVPVYAHTHGNAAPAASVSSSPSILFEKPVHAVLSDVYLPSAPAPAHTHGQAHGASARSVPSSPSILFEKPVHAAVSISPVSPKPACRQRESPARKATPATPGGGGGGVAAATVSSVLKRSPPRVGSRSGSAASTPSPSPSLSASVSLGLPPSPSPSRIPLRTQTQIQPRGQGQAPARTQAQTQARGSSLYSSPSPSPPLSSSPSPASSTSSPCLSSLGSKSNSVSVPRPAHVRRFSTSTSTSMSMSASNSYMGLVGSGMRRPETPVPGAKPRLGTRSVTPSPWPLPRSGAGAGSGSGSGSKLGSGTRTGSRSNSISNLSSKPPSNPTSKPNPNSTIGKPRPLSSTGMYPVPTSSSGFGFGANMSKSRPTTPLGTRAELPKTNVEGKPSVRRSQSLGGAGFGMAAKGVKGSERGWKV